MFSFIKKIFKGTLHKACDKGNIEAVKQHLADGADVNAEVGVGQTPLLLAALGGHKVIAELLIAKGADVNAKMEWAEVDSSEITAVQTPLDCAVDHPEIAALLRKHGGKTGYEDIYEEFDHDDHDDGGDDGVKTGEELKAEGK